MAALTVTLSDIQTVRPVASNLGTTTGVDRLSMYVDEARRMDLQPALSAELLAKIDADATTYATLIAGGTYVYDTETYTFAGLKKALAYFVYARMIRANSVNVTAFGVVTKTDPNSEVASDKRLVMMASDAYDTGVAYLQDCMDYIGRLFPTQTKGEQTDQKKFGFSAIGD
jgi:hypothetical protein